MEAVPDPFRGKNYVPMKHFFLSLRAHVPFKRHPGGGAKDPDPWTHWQWLLALFLFLLTCTTGVGAYLFALQRYGDPFSYPSAGEGVESLDRGALRKVLETYRAKTLEYGQKIESRRSFVDPSR